ncbi:MAG: UDP-N-acetylglucosamine 1-carboxyvinyltransferase [Clostridia bacterium]|nr:UDP-N-acetylglucosamine 1-carboxyvinyltransferase [Clostridia bacterium]
MEKFVINGGLTLNGNVGVQSAKNSVLPLIAASIIHEGKTYIEKCPKIYDVTVMTRIIEKLGGSAHFIGDTLAIDTRDVNDWKLPSDLTGEIRASLFMVGALLTRFGYAAISTPGGCDIGDRPIDIHIDSLRDLGVNVYEGETVIFSAGRKGGGRTKLRYKSVGATENAMMAAIKREGVTLIENAAKEPEIVDLQNYLVAIGCKVRGAGGDVIEIEGVKTLKGGEVSFKPVPDRIEAGTFLLAGAICGGELRFLPESLKNSPALMKIIENNACKIYNNNGKIEYIKFSGRYGGFGKVIVDPYPEFPTDLQPQLVAASSFADGVTVVEERVFKRRFGYVAQLLKTGADVSVFDNACVIVGRKDIHGANMAAGDLRGGAAVLLQALGAKGRSEVSGAHHIDRGYESIEDKLRLLGADIQRISF